MSVSILQNILTFEYIQENIIVIFLALSFAFIIKKFVEGKKNEKLPPGPVGLPLLGYYPFLGKEPHETLLDLSKKYGSNIISLRLGPKLTIVLHDYESTKEVLSHPAVLNRARLFDFFDHVGFAAANGEEWTEQRRFSMNAMKNLGLGRGPWEKLVVEEINFFLEQIASYKGQPTDVFRDLGIAISNNIFSLLFGRRFQRNTEKEKIDLIMRYSSTAFEYVRLVEVGSQIPGLLKFLELFNITGYPKAKKMMRDFSQLIRDEIRMHRLENKENDDFVTLYSDKILKMKTETKKHYFTEDNLEGNLNLLFLGAGDTIYSSITSLLALMAEYQDIQKKVQQELDEVIGQDGKASYEGRFKTPYTFAVLMEAQRFTSNVPLSSTRVASEDFIFQDYIIPKGTEIFSNTWAVHNDLKYWKDPKSFIPERFLDKNGKLITNLSSFLPFSIGKRNCPGETVAWMEILAFFTSILQKFRITPPPGEKVNFEGTTGLVYCLNPQKLCFIERLHN